MGTGYIETDTRFRNNTKLLCMLIYVDVDLYDGEGDCWTDQKIKTITVSSFD